MIFGHVRDRFPRVSLSLPGRERPLYEMTLIWKDEERITEVLALENQPLLGVGLLEGNLLQAEMLTGGEVSLEPL